MQIIERELLKMLLTCCELVHIHVSGTAPGLDIPEDFRNSNVIGFRLSYLATTPPIDIAFDDDALRVTLSFAGGAHRVAVPWTALLQVVGGADVLAGFERNQEAHEQRLPVPRAPVTPKPVQRGGLRLVKG